MKMHLKSIKDNFFLTNQISQIKQNLYQNNFQSILNITNQLVLIK